LGKWDSGQHLHYTAVGLVPVVSEVLAASRLKIPVSAWPDIAERHKTASLRAIAQDYGVSHEAVRRTLRQVGAQARSSCTIGTESEVGEAKDGLKRRLVRCYATDINFSASDGGFPCQSAT
jgi:hypothetical protein